MWALKTKKGFIYEPQVEFDRASLPCLFRTKRHAVAYLFENKELFPTAEPVEIEFQIAEKKSRQGRDNL